MSENRFDIIVIGAGIAGASVAAELAKEARVLLLEMESQPGYHTTGRSAAIFAPNYGPAPIRALTRASEAFFSSPPEGFAENALLSPRLVLMVARDDQSGVLDALIAEVADESIVERLDADEVKSVQPLLRSGYACGGMLDRGGKDIDVNSLHQGFLRTFSGLDGALANRAAVTSLARSEGLWSVETAAGTFEAATVVNAAGAWADEVGALAGAEIIGLTPKRRTALIVAAPDGVEADSLPLTVDIEEEFYLKPDAGRLLISPADETPSPACDAQPEELDVAICVDRIMTAFDVSVRRIENKWAGLRSFVKDKAPVAGFSAKVDGFFWLAGQGGYGIQTAPALARFAAALILSKSVPQDILDEGLDPASIAPDRF